MKNIFYEFKNNYHYRIIKENKKHWVEYKYNQEGEEWNTFGGGVGYSDSGFILFSEAKSFLYEGLYKKDNTFLDLLAV